MILVFDACSCLMSPREINTISYEEIDKPATLWELSVTVPAAAFTIESGVTLIPLESSPTPQTFY